MAVRRKRLAREIAGYVRRESGIAECARAGVVDYATTDLLAAVSGADLVILCTPISRMRELLLRAAPALKRGSIITDVGSVKASVVRELESAVSARGAHFIGSHPMAGAEKSGITAARPDLFCRAVCVVTPTKRSNRRALRTLERFWTSLQSRVIRLSPEIHDRIVSRSSHLPHVTAAALASLVLDPRSPAEQALLCANGFRDTTRVASGSPEMWRDIAMANRRNLEQALDRLVKEVERVQILLKHRDSKGLMRFFEQAKKRRDAWCARNSSPSPE